MDCGRLRSSVAWPFFSTTTGTGRNGFQMLFHQHRARARAAAAVRRRKRLVQVQVHHVHAEIAGARDAGQRVHVGAVHIEQGAARVQQFGNLGDARLERAERGRVGDHQRGDVVGDQVLQMLEVHLPARVGADIFHFVAGDDGGGGIGSVRRIGDQHFLARVAAAGQTGANQQQAGQFALRARGRLQGGGVHAGNFQQALLQRRPRIFRQPCESSWGW